jgi:fructosamine-3-kinase
LLDDALRAELAIDAEERLPGGSILKCYWVSIGGAERFLKVGAKKYADAFSAEADGLAALSSAGARTPQALAHGVAGKNAYLLIGLLELGESGDYAALGRMLAQVHRTRGTRFGWHRDNYIGATAQQNGWSDDWPGFWRDRRLAPQLALAKANGFRIEDAPLERLLQGHSPPPCLLHGDLWGGNAGFAGGLPVIFDPAVYYGDRETDLAMTELFGGFPPPFYAAYNEAYPLDAGYAQRKHLYNFYHLLNHLNIFGGGYYAQVKAALGLLLRAL